MLDYNNILDNSVDNNEMFRSGVTKTKEIQFLFYAILIIFVI